jgi:hypothetical protein
MFNSVVLNVVIGLVFIYLIYSLLATIIQEIIATKMCLRAEMLKKGISRMLDDDNDTKGLSNAFYSHPLIKYLGEKKTRSKPAYLTAKNFSKVLIDLMRGENIQPGQGFNPLIQKALSDEKIFWGAGSKISPQTLTYLKSLWADAQGDVEKYRGLLEQWYDDTMERASGWYKKKTQMILFLIGLTLAIIFNIDSISIATKLSNDPKLAAQLADNASVYLQNNKENLNQYLLSSKDTVKKIDTNAKDQLEANIAKTNALLDSATNLINGNIADSNKLLGLGWKGDEKNNSSKICISCNFHWWSIIGWLITALAISLGAPFWFDLLNKLMQIRNSKKEEPVNKNNPASNQQPITLNLNNIASEEAVG